MSIAEKLTTIAENEQKVLDAGKKADQRAFWEVFQEGGNRTYHMYTFHGSSFKDSNFNPLYTIKIRSYNTNAFYQSGVSDSKVAIDISGASLNNTFRYSKFVTIRELIVNESTIAGSGFTNMSALKNVNVTGTIGNSWNMGDCPLSAESLKSVITALKDFFGTESEYSCTVTFNSNAFKSLEAEGATAEYNGVACTWNELIDNKKWNLTLA